LKTRPLASSRPSSTNAFAETLHGNRYVFHPGSLTYPPRGGFADIESLRRRCPRGSPASSTRAISVYRGVPDRHERWLRNKRRLFS
jgi:hypothetical protein